MCNVSIFVYFVIQSLQISQLTEAFCYKTYVNISMLDCVRHNVHSYFVGIVIIIIYLSLFFFRKRKYRKKVYPSKKSLAVFSVLPKVAYWSVPAFCIAYSIGTCCEVTRDVTCVWPVHDLVAELLTVLVL